MQTSKTFTESVLPPSRGGTPTIDITTELRQQRRRHRLTLQMRSLRFWWYRVLLIIFSIFIAGVISPNAFTLWKLVFGSIVGIILIFVAFKRLGFGYFMAGIVATPFFPTIFSYNLLDICPIVPLLPILFVMVMIRAAFRMSRFVWPAFRVIWPLISLIIIAIVAQIMGQATWLHQIPHMVLGNPAIDDEITGNIMFLFPLLTVIVATTCLTNRSRWITYMQYGLLVLSTLDAVLVINQFRHSGGDVFSFRYAEPTIGFMPLHTLAQLLGVGCIIGYSRLLFATSVTLRSGKVIARWRMRLLYGAIFLLNLLALYYSLQNSWWVEVAAALLVMTLAYSRKLLLVYLVAAIPASPLVINFFNKLTAVKSVDSLRWIIYQDAINIWKMRPLFGVGPGNYWAYHQVYSALPIGARNCNVTGGGGGGLCVAHSGFLQTLVELGPLGELSLLAFIVIMVVTCIRLYRRSRAAVRREDSILGLLGLGLVCGAAAGDLVSSYFLLPPRQMLHVVNLPGSLLTWIVFGCVIYKDQLWRMAERRLKFGVKKSDGAWIAADEISNADLEKAHALDL